MQKHKIALLLLALAPALVEGAYTAGQSPVTWVKEGIRQFEAGQHQNSLRSLETALRDNPKLLEGWFYLGKNLLALGDKSGALRQFERGLALNPNHLPTLLQMSKILTDRPPTAADGLELAVRARKIQPSNLLAVEAHAHALWKNQRLEEAAAIYSDLLKRDPNHRGALYAIAMIAQSVNQPDKALGYLQRILKITPDFKTHLALGSLLEERDQSSQAIFHFQEALRLATPGERAVTGAIKNKLKRLGQNSRAHLFGTMGRDRRDPGGSEKREVSVPREENFALEASPTPPPSKKYTLAPQNFDSGIDFAGNYQGSYENFGDHQKANSDSPRRQSNQPPLATAQLEYHLNLANGYFRQSLFDEAARNLTIILERGDDPYYQNQARKLQKLIAEKNRQRDQNTANTYLELGKDFLSREKFQEAENEFAKVRDLKPNNPELYKNLAILRMKKGNYPEAVDFLKRSLLLDPNQVDSHILMGLILQSEGRYGEALNFIDKARNITADERRLSYCEEMKKRLRNQIQNSTNVY